MKYDRLRRHAAGLSLILSALILRPALAQGVPLPGQSQPGAAAYAQAPPPGAEALPGAAQRATAGPAGGAYAQLPLSVADTQARLDELRSLMPQARPAELSESVNQLCLWLADMVDAHSRLSASFGRNEATRPAAEAERQAAHRFAQLRNQALLLKADLLVRERRFPEALAPLVEITAAEPRSVTGQAAYKRLKEIGFAEEPPAAPAQTSPPPSAPAPPLAARPGQPAAAGAPAHGAGRAAGRAVSAARKQPSRHDRARPLANSGQLPASDSVWLAGSPFGGTRGSRR